MTPLPPEIMAKAKRMLAAGASWNAISRATGKNRETIQRRLDPEYAFNRDKGIQEARALRRQTGVSRRRTAASTNADAERALQALPLDTRPLTARLLGDPLPGRSALDKRSVDIGARNIGVSATESRPIVDSDVFHDPIRDRRFNSEAVIG